MPDILQHETIPTVQRRLDGQGGGNGGSSQRGAPPKKAAASYEEVARTRPTDDRITILGIPIEQITPVTKAALAGLVSENNHLRNVVRRLERNGEKRAANDTAILEPDAFFRALGGTLAQPAGEGQTWVVVLVYVQTYEDIRRSSGLLAANSALIDVAHRLKDVRLGALSFAAIGQTGGSNLAGVAALPADDLDTDAIVRDVREQLTSSGYAVGGIDMALAINVAAAAVGQGESAFLALGRVDHLLRANR